MVLASVFSLAYCFLNSLTNILPFYQFQPSTHDRFLPYLSKCDQFYALVISSTEFSVYTTSNWQLRLAVNEARDYEILVQLTHNIKIIFLLLDNSSPLCTIDALQYEEYDY